MRQLHPLIVLTIVATIVQLLCCSEPRITKNGKKPIKNLEEQPSAKVVKSRFIVKELTEKIIDTTADDKLLQIVFENLWDKQPTDSKKELETVMSWNKSRQAIYMIWFLEAEVNDGGYNQFYYNSSRQFYAYLPSALKLVGANKFAALTTRANKTYEINRKEITKHQDGTVDGFSNSYDDNPLNTLDTEFYKLYKSENLQQIQVTFIRKNKLEFIDK